MCRSPRRKGHATAYVSAKPAPSQEDPRVSNAHGVAGRPQGPCPKAPEGTGLFDPDDLQKVDDRETFPRTCRIRKRAEYDRAFRMGRSRHTPSFRVVVAPGETGVSRLGLVVSKKNVRKAHDRNRVKRFLREYFRKHRNRLDPVLDLVVVAKRGSADLSAAAVASEMDAALREWLAPSSKAR